MGTAKAPRSLRSIAVRRSLDENLEGASGKTVSAVASLIAVASVSNGAQAQQSNLPPVSVDAPVGRPRPVASKPSPEQVRARNTLQRPAQRQQAQQAAAVASQSAGAPDRNPYAAAAPYKVNHLLASGKFPEPLLDDGTLLAANQGTSIPGYWRFDASPGRRSTSFGRLSCSSTTSSTSATTTPCTRVRRRSCWRPLDGPPYLVLSAGY